MGKLYPQVQTLTVGSKVGTGLKNVGDALANVVCKAVEILQSLIKAYLDVH